MIIINNNIVRWRNGKRTVNEFGRMVTTGSNPVLTTKIKQIYG